VVDSHWGLALAAGDAELAKGGNHSLGGRRGHLEVGMGQRRVGGCQRGSRSGRSPVLVVRSFADVRPASCHAAAYTDRQIVMV